MEPTELTSRLHPNLDSTVLCPNHWSSDFKAFSVCNRVDVAALEKISPGKSSKRQTVLHFPKEVPLGLYDVSDRQGKGVITHQLPQPRSLDLK